MILTLNELLESVGNPPADLILLGDGSGQGWNKPAGWAVAGIDRLNGVRWALTGGCSRGTVNWAEAEPYARGLAYDYHFTHKGKLTYQRKVLILSDSEFTVRTGKGEFRTDANGETWAAIQYFVEKGYCLNWHWVPRNNNPMAVVLDQLSKNGDVLDASIEDFRQDLYRMLPWETPATV